MSLTAEMVSDLKTGRSEAGVDVEQEYSVVTSVNATVLYQEPAKNVQDAAVEL